MRGLLVALVGGLGVGVFWRRMRRRAFGGSPAPDPAAELRAKLAESKAAAGEASERPREEPPAPAYDPASRRQAIHERARGAIEELH